MKLSESEARRQLEARQPGQNIMGGERFQIVRKTFKAAEVAGKPPVLDTIITGPFKAF